MPDRAERIGMTDKERILMMIVTRIIPGLRFSPMNRHDEYVTGSMLSGNNVKHGDLVFANTTIDPNDFMVGFVERVEENGNVVVIREIGTDRLCNYSNESFSVINKDKLGYEALEGIQYKMFRKTLKAFSEHTGYTTRFKSIRFDGKTCIVEARKTFSNDAIFEARFDYDSKTTIKGIGAILSKLEASA